MKPRVIYVQNGTADASRPTVRISKTNEGVTFSVSATGRSLNLARIRAVRCFRALEVEFAVDVPVRKKE